MSEDVRIGVHPLANFQRLMNMYTHFPFLFWMLHSAALVTTDILEKRIAPVIRATRIGKLGTMSAVTSNRNMLRNIGSYKRHTA
jgi:hypothetical protein